MNFSINNQISKQEITELGLSALSGRTPDLRDAQNRPFEPKYDKGTKFLTSDSIFQHVDFEAQYPLTITFDMENPTVFEKAIVAGFGEPKNYALAEYELYAANNNEHLYDEQNKVAIYNVEETATNRTLFEFNEPQTARYFGVKVIKPCTADNIARIARIGVYSKEYQLRHTYINKYGINAVLGVDPEIMFDDGNSARFSTVFGKREHFNDGVAFDPLKTVRLRFKQSFETIYRLPQKIDIDKIVIAHNDELPEIEVYAATDIKKLYEQPLKTAVTTEKVAGSSLTVFKFPTTEATYCSIKFIKGEADFVELSEIAVMSPITTVDASSGKVINDNYVGSGENLVPFAIQPGNILAGYTEELFASDCNRVLKIRPNLIRLWMQVDWFEKQKGVYNFDTPEMEAVWRYLELFKKSGSEVQLTHSWKVGEEAQEWFSIPGVPEPRNSAPVDFEHYAEGYAALMKEIWRRGYDNVFHVSFANEPGFSWDFQCFGNRKDYYCRMVRAVHDRFVAEGIRSKCKFWCCESAEDVTWLEYCREYISECVDYYTLHCYECPEDHLEETMMKKVRERGMLPYLLTECSENGADQTNPWNRSLSGLLIESSNLGGGGIVMWTLHGVKSMSVYSPNSWTMGESGHLWDTQLLGGMPNRNYYCMSMFTRYLYGYSSVLETVVSDNKMRAATFLSPDGETTVLVECSKSDAARSIKVKLPKGSYTLYKHIYNPTKLNCTYDAIIPEAISVIECESEFVDNEIPNDYCTVVYTTIKPQGQIALADTILELEAGESYQFSARLIDCSGEIEYSTMAGKGTITKDGLFTANGLKSGETVAVFATSKNDPTAQGIAVIRIK